MVRPPKRAVRMAEAKRLTADAPETVPSTAAASIPDTPCTIAIDTIWARMIECPTQPTWWMAMRSHTGRLLRISRTPIVTMPGAEAGRGSFGRAPRRDLTAGSGFV